MINITWFFNITSFFCYSFFYFIINWSCIIINSIPGAGAPDPTPRGHPEGRELRLPSCGELQGNKYSGPFGLKLPKQSSCFTIEPRFECIFFVCKFKLIIVYCLWCTWSVHVNKFFFFFLIKHPWVWISKLINVFIWSNFSLHFLNITLVERNLSHD